MNSRCFNAFEIYSTNMLEDSHERENKLQVRQIEFNVNREMTVKDCVVILRKPVKRKQYDIKLFQANNISKLNLIQGRLLNLCQCSYIHSFLQYHCSVYFVK